MKKDRSGFEKPQMKKFGLKVARKDVWYHFINEKRVKKVQNNTNEEIILEKNCCRKYFWIVAKMKQRQERIWKTKKVD